MVVEAADTLALSDLDIIALTLVGEARGLHHTGMVEVACTIINRLNANKWWGHSERAICLYPWQFSCWNDHDAASRAYRQKLINWPSSDASYQDALTIAADAMIDVLPDITNGATHYFNHVTIPEAKWPKWYRPGISVACHIDEPHWFFDLSETG